MENTERNTPSIDIDSLIKETKQLVSLPSVCIKVNQMVDDESSSSEDLGKVISHDVNLSARLLKIANSSFYGFPSKIETISRAITIIGDSELRSLVLATAAVDTFDNVPIDIASMASFWKHSLHCGIISRLIAGKCGIKRNEQLFVAGLLHDVGHLVLFQKYPEIEKDILINASLNEKEVHLVEAEKIGFDHARLGGELLKEWGLPASLYIPVEYHHQPSAAPEDHRLEASIVYIANIVAKNAQIHNYSFPYDKLTIDDTARDLVNFNESVLNDLMEELPLQFTNAVELFLTKEIEEA